MYFESRAAAGELLALELAKLRYESTAVVSLSEGGVAVGAPIARALHSTLSILISRPIDMPSAAKQTIGAVGQDGSFIFDDQYSPMEAEELAGEFHGFIEQEKIRQLHDINALASEIGVVGPDLLRGHVVIAVSDGLAGNSSLEALRSFLRPIKVERMVVAVPIASVKAVDAMHIMFDEIHCLYVSDNYLETDHYYNDEKPPTHEAAMATIRQIITEWQ